ncbi:DinB family protein [Pseudalkalibacillus caeni]|uniref:DUF664 domain-containing protein n=1 Tax=Exobacillus caeni TaxID=2574798 RepID=A0A5R9F6Y3_9BACL|nr:DinB family protein [Pseudalkalibacillus caeni]TLS36593.1 DUF664 domain-containing protein [Pseudalkalibacillus caeni]
MDASRLFLIDKVEGYSMEFSRLVAMLRFTRITTLDEVRGLSIEQLDFRYEESANSIGMLLSHIAAIEKAYQIETFEGRYLTEEEIDSLNPALQLGPEARIYRDKPFEAYLKELEKARDKTLETFATLPDSWLYEQSMFWGGKPGNNYFKWFHVLEDELNHRGQIRILKKMYNLQSTM